MYLKHLSTTLNFRASFLLCYRVRAECALHIPSLRDSCSRSPSTRPLGVGGGEVVTRKRRQETDISLFSFVLPLAGVQMVRLHERTTAVFRINAPDTLVKRVWPLHWNHRDDRWHVDAFAVLFFLSWFMQSKQKHMINTHTPHILLYAWKVFHLSIFTHFGPKVNLKQRNEFKTGYLNRLLRSITKRWGHGLFFSLGF